MTADLRTRPHIDLQLDAIDALFGVREVGTASSGNFGHAGRPGHVGGSQCTLNIKTYLSPSDMPEDISGRTDFWVGRDGEIVYQDARDHYTYLTNIQDQYPQDSDALFGQFESTSRSKLDDVIENGAIRGAYDRKKSNLYLQTKEIDRSLIVKIKQWIKDGVMPTVETLTIGTVGKTRSGRIASADFILYPGSTFVNSGEPYLRMSMDEFEHLATDAILRQLYMGHHQIQEGGQGSGNIGHAGIPGHQGGSQPTGVKGPLERSDKENEQWSLDFYTSDGVGSMDMNRDLRSGKPLEPLRQKEADGIKSLCSHSTPGVDKVYRGMIVKDRGTAEKMFPNGREIIDKGIMSTSAKLEFAKEFTTEKSGYRVLMFIDVPKGAHGYRWNDPNDNFDEVILPPGTRLHIRSCALHRDDCYVYAEIVK